MSVKQWIRPFILVFGGVWLMTACRTGDQIKLQDLLPAGIQGWQAPAGDKEYDRETIFDYIDGAGELYRAYHFKGLLARRYKQDGSPDIIADLFDMGEPRNAFGVFTHDRLGEEVGIGQGSVYKTGLLSFWKDRFYVSLYAEEENDGTKKAVLELGKHISARIKRKGETPEPVAWLPQEGLEPNSVRYFYNHHILNMHFFLADGNIMNLDQECDGVLGTYTQDGNASHLLVVRYPDKGKAGAALESFKKAYMPDAGDREAVQTENRKWIVVGQKQAVLVVHLDAFTEKAGRDLTERCLEAIEN